MPQLTVWLFHHGRFIAPALGALAGLYWFLRGIRLVRRKRLILSAPASKIRSAPMGLVELSGLATSPYLMASPLKRTECYFYRSLAWERKPHGNRGDWVKIAEEILHVPFYIDDHTDKVLVDPRGANIDLHCYWREEYQGAASPRAGATPERIAQFLLRHDVDPANRLIKVEEYTVRPKDFLFVLGTLSQNPGLDVSVMPAWAERADRPALTSDPSEGPEVIRLSGEAPPVPAAEMTQQQKIAAALMRAGANNSAGWRTLNEQAPPPPRQLAEKESSSAAVATSVMEESAALDISGFDLHPPVVLMKGTHESPFFISWRSPRDRFKRFDWKSTLLTLAGPALALACLYLLFGFGAR